MAVVAVAVAALLSGCAAIAEAKREKECDQWFERNRQAATSLSDFYRREIERDRACDPTPEFALIDAKLVIAAQHLEAGRITRDQFELYKSQLWADYRRESDARMRAMMPVPVLLVY